MADEKPTVTDKASPLEMEKFKHSSLESVSYTHLDVYKRQVKRREYP